MVAQDPFGNMLIREGNSIYLKLFNQKRKRLIGSINEETKTLYVQRKQAKHIMRKIRAYGFNHYLLSTAKRFDKVQLTDEDGTYLLPVADILRFGSFLFFKTQGFEKQIFLGLDYIKQNEIR